MRYKSSMQQKDIFDQKLLNFCNFNVKLNVILHFLCILFKLRHLLD